ncbi:S8 family serine peptidase [Halorussus sp. MSC15.2]|uniref:S8 family peptidase n=1 Tax=Halorussus sp. MSC15.2 TaxID=2283638 RepID=UPI0013D79FAD|nr:S8 family serine peptidase [Halorussus sp. MSC15.2]NEU58883.1 S8 family serine peptidase [Halorussus sp. MSC15.2]
MDYDRRTFIKAVAAAGLTVSAVRPVAAGSDTRYVVNTDGSGVQSHVEDAGYSIQHELGGNVLLVTGSSENRTALEDVNGVGAVARDVSIEFEKPEKEADETTDEDYYSLQWDKQVTDVSAAHDTATGDGTRLAIIDTGIDVDHPDLQANVDADAGRLFKFGDVSHDTTDVYGHGSHVAGIAAASDDGTTGVVGTAPDAELVSLRVFYYYDYDGDGETELYTTVGDIFTAIDHAASIDADAANMSIGTPPLPPEVNAGGIRGAYERVIRSATQRGTVVVASAGNSDANLQQGGYFTTPNSVSGAMSISATGPNDERVFYSNYGTDEIDVGAPGGGYETLEKTLASDTEWPYPTNLVLSSVPPEIYGANYAYFAGTSMAAPQVTGTVGLVRSIDPDAPTEAVEQAIRSGAEGVDGQSSADLGAGRLNADKALDANNIN